MAHVDGLRIERTIDLPREIVWEALVDPVLVAGWLHPHEQLAEGVEGVVVDEPEVLEVVSPEFGRVRVVLTPVLGGPRGTSTRLRLEVDDGSTGSGSQGALWERRLDQLDELLRGRPVDWREAR